MSARRARAASILQMDPTRLGRGIRPLRRRRGWRQEDLATAARISRTAVSRIELGGGERSTVRTLEAIAAALGARLEIRVSWNGEALDRLLDSAHARLVELRVLRLEAWGWESAREVSFSIGVERGSIDLLEFHRPTGRWRWSR